MVNTGLLGIQICTLKKILGMDAVVCFCNMSLERPKQEERACVADRSIYGESWKLREKACSYIFFFCSSTYHRVMIIVYIVICLTFYFQIGLPGEDTVSVCFLFAGGWLHI